MKSNAQTPRYKLTICATLVRNPANLGALCRTCEVFYLSQLVVSSLQVVEDREFCRLAVSSQQWQPMMECSADCLPEWLSQHQREGATIVSLSRDEKASPLPTFSFPERTVLLLGQELTGIPRSLLAMCDERVEIPQSGRVDSLNVSTAAAIAAYAYLTQYGNSSG